MGLFYLRYMDDVLILCHTWHQLRRAVRQTNHLTLGEFDLKKHPNKTFIGHIRGLDRNGKPLNRNPTCALAKKRYRPPAHPMIAGCTRATNLPGRLLPVSNLRILQAWDLHPTTEPTPFFFLYLTQSTLNHILSQHSVPPSILPKRLAGP